MARSSNPGFRSFLLRKSPSASSFSCRAAGSIRGRREEGGLGGFGGSSPRSMGRPVRDSRRGRRCRWYLGFGLGAKGSCIVAGSWLFIMAEMGSGDRYHNMF
jgi:hypothetical protein